MTTYSDNVTATFSADTPQNARNMGSEKELVEALSIVAADDRGNLYEPLTLRWYMARSRSASVSYCSLWIHDGKGSRYRSGFGKAGGYGYCRASAAADEAFRSAGVTFRKEGRERPWTFHGAGMHAVEEAAKATVRALGYTGRIALVRH